MKIAVPTRERVVDDHFGHCEVYTIFTINADKKVIHEELLPSPQGCGCKSNIGVILQKIGVTIMLAGNMGNGALNVLNFHGIDVYRGCAGNVHHLVETFLKGNIEDSGKGCHTHEGHEEGHSCSH